MHSFVVVALYSDMEILEKVTRKRLNVQCRRYNFLSETESINSVYPVSGSDDSVGNFGGLLASG